VGRNTQRRGVTLVIGTPATWTLRSNLHALTDASKLRRRSSRHAFAGNKATRGQRQCKPPVPARALPGHVAKHAGTSRC